MHDNNLPVDMHRPNPQPVPKGLKNTEPALQWGGIVAAIAAALVVAKAFGLPLSEEQESAVLQFLAVLGPIITAVVIRQSVFSPASTVKIANEAAVTGDANVPEPPGKK